MKNNNKKFIEAIYFHKTIQDPEHNSKDAKRCYYYPKMDIDINNFKEMECIQSNDKMENMYVSVDLAYIKEIISRPFLEPLENENNKKKTFLDALTGKNPSVKGGTKKKTRRNRRKSVRRNRRR